MFFYLKYLKWFIAGMYLELKGEFILTNYNTYMIAIKPWPIQLRYMYSVQYGCYKLS